MDGLSGNNLLTSKTGRNFSAIPIQGNAATFSIYDLECNLEQTNQITFPQNTTLALGGVAADTTKIAYSTNSGITWTASTSASGVFSGSCNAAVWNGKIWVALGSVVISGTGNTIATSPDGINWTGRGAYIFSTAGNAVAWAKELGLWVATGQGTNVAAYSYDGVYWFAGSNTSSLLSGNDVKWNGATWVLAGSTNNVGILYSSDGKNWTQVQVQNLVISKNVAISPNNYAQSWNLVSVTTDNWLVIREDSTGMYQAAIDVSGIIYNTSTVWSTAPTTYSTGISLGSNPGVNGAAIAVSGNGAVQYALLNGATNPLWVSTNYGATWTNTVIAAFTGTKVGWTGIATDATGSYILVTSNLSSAMGGIWLTTTGAGGAWSKIAGYTGMNGCSMSSTGQWQTTVDIYGAVYTSSAYGAGGSWTTASAPNAFNTGIYQTPATKIAMSSTGKYITASYASSSTVTTDAYNMMLSSATNGVMDNSGNIYMGGNQSAGSQIIYKISVSSGGGGGSTVAQIANLSALGATVFVNQSMPMALDQTNGVLYFNQVSTNVIYKVVISTGVTTLVTTLNTSLGGLSTVSPSAMVCDSTGNLYVAIASAVGTTAYLCKYTTGGVFSSVSKSVSAGTLSLGVDRSNNLYLSYPNQVDQYSSALVLGQAGFYNSGRFVKSMAFDAGGSGYFYDAGSIVKISTNPVYTNTQVLLPSNQTSCVLQDLSQNILMLYSNTINLYNSQNIFMNTVTGVTGSIYKMAFDTGYNLYTITQSGTCNIYKYTYNGSALVNVNGSSPYITNAVMTNIQGFNIDTNNNIYVTNNGNIIYKYLAGNTTGYSTYVSTTANISGAQGTTIDSNNTLYWINTNGNTIAKQSYTTSNNNLGNVIISNLPAAPYGGLTIDNAGYIYVGTASSTNNYVMKYSSVGILQSQYFISNLGSNATQSLYYTNNSFYVGLNSSTVVSSYNSNQQITGLTLPQYSCVDSFGAIYTTNYSTGTVSKYGSSSSIFVNSGLISPFMVATDSNGFIYILNQYGSTSNGYSTVIQYNANGTVKNSSFVPAYASTNSSTCGMAIDSNNYMYVSSFVTGKVYQYHINSSGIIDSSNVSFYSGSANQIQTVNIDLSNNVYLGLTTGTIYKFTMQNGTINSTISVGGAGNVWQIAFDSQNNLYVAGSSSSASGVFTIQKYTSSLVALSSITLSNSLPSSQGVGLTIKNNILYLSTFVNGTVNMYNLSSSGATYIKTIVNVIVSSYITQLSVDSNNNLYVPVSLNGNGGTGGGYVLKYNIIPSTILNYITGLSNPTGCAIDPTNNLYVCNSGTGIVNAYSYGNTSPITYVSGLTNPASCVMDNTGILYTLANSKITKTLVSSSNANYPYGTGLGAFCITFDTSNNLYASFSSSPWVAKFTVGASSVTFASTLVSTGCYGVTYSNGYVYSCQSGGTGYVHRYNISTSTDTSNFITMAYPMYCSVDKSGNIYVSSYQTSGFISMYSSAGASLNASLISGNQPYATCFDSLGYFYVNWTGTSQIIKYLLNGTTAPISMLTITASGSTRGLSVDNFNNLYYGTGTINVYSSVTGKILRTFSTTMGSDAGNFDNSGNFWYWQYAAGAGNFVKTSFPTTNSTIITPAINSNQFAIDSSGNLLIPTKKNTISSSNFALYGVSSYVVANANNVCFDSLNNLYATSNVNPTQYIYKYSYGNTTTRTTFLSFSDSDSRGITMDNMDNLYVCRNTINQIQVYNQSSSLINTISCTNPLFCCFDRAYKYLYVSSINSVLKYDTSGNNLATIGTVTGVSQIVLDPYGYFWAIGYSASNTNVFKFDSSGNTYTTTISGVNCNGIAIDGYGYIYLNYNQNVVYMYTYTGQLLSSNLFTITSANAFGVDNYGAIYSCSWSGGIKSFNPNIIGNVVSPSGIAIDSSNNIYVTTGNTITGISVSKYTSTGNIISPNYIQGSYITPLKNPSLTMDTANNLYITDSSTNTVNIFNTSTVLSQSFVLQNFTFPYLTSNYGLQTNTNLLSMDSNTNLYYSQTYAQNGFNIYKITSGLSASTYYSNAATSNMVSDTSGNLYWTTSGNSIVKYNTITQTQSIYTDINSGGITLSFLNNPTGLAIDVSNNLYVCSGTSIAKVAYSNPLNPSILYSGFMVVVGYPIISSNIAGTGNIMVNFSGLGFNVLTYSIYRNGTNIYNGTPNINGNITIIPQYYYAFNTADVTGTNLKNITTGLFDASLNNGALINSTIFKMGTASLSLTPSVNTSFVNTSNVFTSTININSAVLLSNTTMLICTVANTANPIIGNLITGNVVQVAQTIYGEISISNSKQYIINMRANSTNIIYIFTNNNGIITPYSTASVTFPQNISNIQFSFNDTKLLISGTNGSIFLNAWNNGSPTTTMSAQPNISFPNVGYPNNWWQNITTNNSGSLIAYIDNGDRTKLYYASWNATNSNYNTASSVSISASGTVLGCTGLQFTPDSSILYISFWNSTSNSIYYSVCNGSTIGSPSVVSVSPSGQPVIYMANSILYYINLGTPTVNQIINSITYTSQYAKLPSNISILSSGISISTWIYPSSLTGTIFELANGATSDNIIFGINNGYLTSSVYYSSTPYTTTTSSNPVTINSWNHVVWTLSNTNPSIWTFYVNGTAIISTTSNTIYPNITIRNINYIGQSSNTLFTPYSGYIDDLRLFYVLLQPSEVSTIYGNTTNPTITRSNYIYIDTNVINGQTYNYSIVAQNTSTTILPYSLAIDLSSNIYVLLAGSPPHTIYKITSGGASGLIYYLGNTTNGLYYGYGIAVDTSNNLYVASINASQTMTSVNRISASGSYTTLFTVNATNSFTSGYSALSIDPYNNLYLSVGNTVTKYNIASQTTGNFAVSTSAPISLAFDANFNTYMMDTSYNVHIDKMQIGSTRLMNSPNYGLSGSWVAGNLSNISDIAISGILQSVISNGTVYASTNGGSSFIATPQINCISVSISQNGGLLSTVMTSGSIYYSCSFGNSTNLIWNGRAWINVISNNLYITSVDGIRWNSVSVGISNAATNMVYTEKSQTTLLSSGSSVYSTYTNNYGNLSVGALSFPVSALIFNGSYYLAGGNVVATSVDAQTWTAGNAILGMSAIKTFAWNTPDQGTASIKPMTIAMGQGNTNTIGYSYDGIQWYGAGSSVFTARGNKAVWNGQIWCAVGAGVNWVASSYNGVVWTGRNTYMMNEGYDIAWNGVAFVAVGIGATPIVTSPNGINWYPVANSISIFTNYVSSIVWTGYIWMAYGSSASGPVVGICTNPNGTTWTTKTVASLSLTPKTRPIVTKTNVLHPLTTTSGTTYLYSTADLYGNAVSGNVNLVYPINGNLTGLTMPIVTASVFDGYNYLVVDVSGNGGLMTNQASNTNLAFTSTYAGSAISTNLSTVNGGAYNGKLVMLGGSATTGGNVITYNTFGTGTSSQFTAATSANLIFTQVNGLASNSGYGPIYVANALYLNVGDKLSMVGPKAYSQTIAPTTNITVNLLNTATNPQNIATVYPSVTPTK